MDKKELTGTQKDMFDNLLVTLGNVTSSAQKTGISRGTHYLWMNTDENYRQWINEIENHQIDFYETALHRLIQDGNVAAIIFALKCKGKKRGWFEKNEIAITDHQQTITINIIQPKSEQIDHTDKLELSSNN